jgi:ATP-dependent Lon protease
VGGIKEKVLAAHRSGLKTVILPKRNESDLEELPEEVRKSMKFVFVETVDEVLKAALEPASRRKNIVKAKDGKGKKNGSGDSNAKNHAD